MSGDYQIIKANAQPGIDGVTALELIVQEMTRDGWTPAGGPFYDGAAMKWCQAMHRATPAAGPDEVRLREPQPPVAQAPDLRVNVDPKDGPLKLREPKPRK